RGRRGARGAQGQGARETNGPPREAGRSSSRRIVGSGGLGSWSSTAPLTVAAGRFALLDGCLVGLRRGLAGATRRGGLAARRKDPGEERLELLPLDGLLLDEQSREPIEHRALRGECL